MKVKFTIGHYCSGCGQTVRYFLAQIVINLMQTANKKAKELLSNYFSEYLFTSEEELSQAYLANRIHGLSFNLSLLKNISN